MKPLKVTAVMTDGRVASIDGRLRLDSMLAYVWMAENHPDVLRTNTAATDRIIDCDLSGLLDRRGQGNDWYWASSQGVFKELCENIEYFHKRISPERAEKYVDFGGKRGKIVIAGGPYKAWRHPVVVRLVPKIDWYCVGDAHEIRRMLNQYIIYIGKHRGIGCGLIREWIVEPFDHDWSVYGPAGQLMRPIPDKEGYAMCGIRPPYWSPQNQRICKTMEVDHHDTV